MGDPTSVYLYYDVRNVLLYVGITNRGKLRQDEHAQRAEWWKYSVSQKIEHYESRVEARARETWLIINCRPPFNNSQNPGYHDLRDAYLTLFDPSTPIAGRPACGELTECSGGEADGCMWNELMYQYYSKSCMDAGCERCHTDWHIYCKGSDDGEVGERTVVSGETEVFYRTGSERVMRAVLDVYMAIWHLNAEVFADMNSMGSNWPAEDIAVARLIPEDVRTAIEGISSRATPEEIVGG